MGGGGVNSRCLVQVYVARKIEGILGVHSPHDELTRMHVNGHERTEAYDLTVRYASVSAIR